MQQKGEVDGRCSALAARIISGSIGSIVTSLVVTPLEVVKVRTQVSFASATTTSATITSPITLPSNVGPCPRGCGTFVLYNGHMDCVLPKSSLPFFEKPLDPNKMGTFSMVRHIFQKEGLAGIYAGFRPTLVMAVPNTVLYFSAYEEIVWRLRSTGFAGSDNSAWLFPLAAGASARLVSSTVTAPFEFIKTRQAAAGHQRKLQTGLWKEFESIVRAEGVSSLYRGLLPTLWRDVPFSAIYWLAIEQFRLLWKQRDADTPSPSEQAGQAFINGAVSGMVAAACTTPFDVIKTRQQSAKEISVTEAVACKHNGASVYKPHGTLSLLLQIARAEGLAGLWKGNQARMLKVAPACAIMISSYEFGKRILE